MTTSQSEKAQGVLAIDVTSRGFGFSLFETPTTLIDWGGRTVLPDKEVNTVKEVQKLLQHHRPKAIILEDHRGSRRCDRMKKIIDEIRKLAENEHVKCRAFTMIQVKKVFLSFRAATKDEIARAIAQQVPTLAPRLPRVRKPWLSEAYGMG